MVDPVLKRGMFNQGPVDSGPDFAAPMGPSFGAPKKEKSTNTSLSQSVADGKTIIWRVKDSFTSGNFTHMTYETESASDEVDCPYIDPGASQVLGDCSGTSKTSTLTLTNSSSANTTAYFQVRYSTDGGSSWTEKEANQSVSSGGSAQLTQSVNHGKKITWSYRSSSSSGSFSGGYTAVTESSIVDCPIIDTGASQSLGSCSSESKASTISLTNSDSANTEAYFEVQYSLDGGTSWTEKTSNQSVSSNSFAKALDLTTPPTSGETTITSFLSLLSLI